MTRSLVRSRALALTVVFTLGLGVGALILTFGVVNAALLRQPPFDEAKDLALLYIQRNEEGEPPRRERWSFARFELLSQQQQVFENVASYSPGSATLVRRWQRGDAPVRARFRLVLPAAAGWRAARSTLHEVRGRGHEPDAGCRPGSPALDAPLGSRSRDHRPDDPVERRPAHGHRRYAAWLRRVVRSCRGVDSRDHVSAGHVRGVRHHQPELHQCGRSIEATALRSTPRKATSHSLALPSTAPSRATPTSLTSA